MDTLLDLRDPDATDIQWEAKEFAIHAESVRGGLHHGRRNVRALNEIADRIGRRALEMGHRKSTSEIFSEIYGRPITVIRGQPKALADIVARTLNAAGWYKMNVSVNKDIRSRWIDPIIRMEEQREKE